MTEMLEGNGKLADDAGMTLTCVVTRFTRCAI